MEFISGKPECFNIKKFINLICYIFRSKGNTYIIISIEMEKALSKFNTHPW